MGEPLKQYQRSYGSEAASSSMTSLQALQISFDYIAQEKAAMSEADAPYMTTILKIDKDTKMGLVTEVKQKLREQMRLRFSIAAT